MIKHITLAAIAAILGISAVAQGATIESRVYIVSESENNVNRHVLRELGEGRFEYIYDPNHCSAAGICTELAPHREEIVLEQISDATPVDGPRVFKINENMTLSYSAWTRIYSFCSQNDEGVTRCVGAKLLPRLETVR